MSDKGYEKLIRQIKRVNETKGTACLGTVKSAASVSVGDQTLEQDDLMIDSGLGELKQGETVLLIKVNDEKYVIVGKVHDL